MALGVMDAEFSEDLDEEKATNLALKAIRSSIQRDSASGDGIDMLIINKNGKSENSYPA
jgi:proteasome beta subunit